MIILLTALLNFVLANSSFDERSDLFPQSAVVVSRDDLGNRRSTMRPLLDGMAESYIEQMEQDLSQHQLKQIKLVKYYLFQGQLKKAQNFVQSLYLSDVKNRKILDRYLSLIYYLSYEFEKAHQLLLNPGLQVFPHFSRICFLQTTLEIILNRTTLLSTWNRCKLENQTTDLKLTDHWLELLIQLKVSRNPDKIKSKIQTMNLKTIDHEQLKYILKMSIYLGIDKNMIPAFDDFDFSIFADPELRELMAFIYYKNHQYENALKIGEGLQTSNMENIKGILYLKLKKYELAFAQFQLALKIKNNSFNAVKRSLPLTMLLELPEAGLKILQQHVSLNEANRLPLRTLESYFLIEKEDYAKAQKILLQSYFQNVLYSEHELHALLAYASLQVQDHKTFIYHSEKSCSLGDLLGCWALVENNVMNNQLHLMIKRDEAFEEKTEQDLLHGEIFKDYITVNQKDIDELDNNLIQLGN